MSATDAHPLSSSWIDGIELYGQERTTREKKTLPVIIIECEK